MRISKSVRIKTFIHNAIENLIKHTNQMRQARRTKKHNILPRKILSLIANPPKYQPKIPT
ncbi:hypothetical protein [Helicobacter sp. MIT 01-3238]|uniref:hypothetical protein n=1 Tax=Helicobacter sp. MIT 01-3238 TaxID=398627 RepID=UPI0011C01BA3|nr:hypothetical protein [Helicobacter sp. MIT 01-3238]